MDGKREEDVAKTGEGKKTVGRKKERGEDEDKKGDKTREPKSARTAVYSHDPKPSPPQPSPLSTKLKLKVEKEKTKPIGGVEKGTQLGKYEGKVLKLNKGRELSQTRELPRPPPRYRCIKFLAEVLEVLKELGLAGDPTRPQDQLALHILGHLNHLFLPPKRREELKTDRPGSLSTPSPEEMRRLSELVAQLPLGTPSQLILSSALKHQRLMSLGQLSEIMSRLGQSLYTPDKDIPTLVARLCRPYHNGRSIIHPRDEHRYLSIFRSFNLTDPNKHHFLLFAPILAEDNAEESKGVVFLKRSSRQPNKRHHLPHSSKTPSLPQNSFKSSHPQEVPVSTARRHHKDRKESATTRAVHAKPESGPTTTGNDPPLTKPEEQAGKTKQMKMSVERGTQLGKWESKTLGQITLSGRAGGEQLSRPAPDYRCIKLLGEVLEVLNELGVAGRGSREDEVALHILGKLNRLLLPPYRHEELKSGRPGSLPTGCLEMGTLADLVAQLEPGEGPRLILASALNHHSFLTLAQLSHLIASLGQTLYTSDKDICSILARLSLPSHSNARPIIHPQDQEHYHRLIMSLGKRKGRHHHFLLFAPILAKHHAEEANGMVYLKRIRHYPKPSVTTPSPVPSESSAPSESSSSSQEGEKEKSELARRTTSDTSLESEGSEGGSVTRAAETPSEETETPKEATSREETGSGSESRARETPTSGEETGSNSGSESRARETPTSGEETGTNSGSESRARETPTSGEETGSNSGSESRARETPTSGEETGTNSGSESRARETPTSGEETGSESGSESRARETPTSGEEMGSESESVVVEDEDVAEATGLVMEELLAGRLRVVSRIPENRPFNWGTYLRLEDLGRRYGWEEVKTAAKRAMTRRSGFSMAEAEGVVGSLPMRPVLDKSGMRALLVQFQERRLISPDCAYDILASTHFPATPTHLCNIILYLLHPKNQ